MENKRKIKIKKLILILILILISILAIGLKMILNYENKIELCQLKDNGSSQMMGYIITTKNKKTIVIDGGTDKDTQNLIEQIKQRTGKVDYWFITHPHKDHATCFINIVQNTDIKIENVYVTLNEIDWYKQYEPQRTIEAENLQKVLQNEKIKDKVTEVKLNQEINIDNIRCKILGIKNPEITTNAINNSSMVIRMQVNNKTILFLGDTGKESSEKLIKEQPQKELKADIVQMAHHGQNGATEELYKIINPKICLWPTPQWLWDNNSGGGEDSGNWKTKETRKWIENLKVEQNIIEKDGNKTIKIW